MCAISECKDVTVPSTVIAAWPSLRDAPCSHFLSGRIGLSEAWSACPCRRLCIRSRVLFSLLSVVETESERHGSDAWTRQQLLVPMTQVIFLTSTNSHPYRARPGLCCHGAHLIAAAPSTLALPPGRSRHRAPELSFGVLCLFLVFITDILFVCLEEGSRCLALAGI
jgi:hypothetical protein